MGAKVKYRAYTFVALLLVGLTACSSTPQRSTSDVATIQSRADEAYRLGLLTEAESHYLELTRSNPKYIEAWLRLGNIYVRTGQLDAAVRVYQKMIELQPDDVRGWNNLALARIKQASSTLLEGRGYMAPNSREREVIDRLLDNIVSITSEHNRTQ